MGLSKRSYVPSPALIRQKCEEIQVAWSRKEREKRIVAKRPRFWEVPQIEGFTLTEMDEVRDWE
jgi:hypothetical protein